MPSSVADAPARQGLSASSRTSDELEPVPGVAGWVHVDLGHGPAAYARLAVPGPGETHPHLLGLYAPGPRFAPDALAAFAPTLPEHGRMRMRPAAQLRIDRHLAEAECGQVVTAWAWCVRCGNLFRDERAGRGTNPRPTVRDGEAWPDPENLVGGVAWRCPACQDRSRLPASRRCAAPACGAPFQPADARQFTCKPCRKRLADERLRHERFVLEHAHFEGDGYERGPRKKLRCIAGKWPYACLCLPCEDERLVFGPEGRAELAAMGQAEKRWQAKLENEAEALALLRSAAAHGTPERQRLAKAALAKRERAKAADDALFADLDALAARQRHPGRG